jgi:hypothetical protein
VVRAIDEASTAVDFMDPVTILALASLPEIDAVADEAKKMLQRVRDHLSS